MDLKNFFKKEYIIGLDIGVSSVKFAQFTEKKDGLHLIKAGLKELDASGDSNDREKETLSALKYLLSGIDLKRCDVIAAINCPAAAIKKVIAPYMPKSELREGIALESKNYFPFPIDKSLLDFDLLGDVVEKGVRKYEVLVGVCPLDSVNTNISLLEKAGMKSTSFVLSSYALYKLAQAASSKPDELRCFMDIGELHTELIICKGKTLAFSRKIPVCGSDFTRALTGVLISDIGKTQLTLKEAETIKREIGMPVNSDTRIIDNKISTSQILAMLRAPAEHIADEISRCFDYYREESGGGKINSITVFGGGASLSGLIKFLSDAVGMEVRLGDGLEGLDTEKDAVPVPDRKKISHRVELAVGAALSGKKGMNLLPPELKEETTRAIKRSTIDVIITAVIIASVLSFMGMRIKINNFDKRIDAARLELSSLQPELKKAEARRLAEMVLKNEPYWEDIFNELGSLIPGNINIDNIRMENQTIIMKGTAASDDGQQALGDFIIALEKGLFNSVSLVESRNVPDGTGVEFEIKCWIDYGQ